jgi:exonuclease SbcC
MKPINLKIKGLNSFIEVQEINFERLTEKGLFGIFGPTGSGKSTILDGVTLALYGEVARKSSNYMNTNCNSLNISYEFQISEKEVKRYRVEREFKRDTKTDSVRTKSAKIIGIEGDIEIVLEDKVTLVTKKCEEIIGLKLEDFTRTVVLPQGNFSEFLKLEGKERRNMLERLFNLQMYGDELSYKLGSKAKKEREAANLLEGELNSYEDCNEAILEEKRKEQESREEKYKEELKFSKEVDKIFNENKELWGLQEELKDYVEKYNEFKEIEEDINHNRQKVNNAEKAQKVKPYYDSYKETSTGINNGIKELSKAQENFSKVEAEKEKCEVVYDKAKAKKDNELSGMIVKEQQFKDAIVEQRELFTLVEKSKQLQQQIDEINITKSELEKTQKENQAEINIISVKIEDNSKEIEGLKTPEEYKERIRFGLSIQERFENSEKDVNTLEGKVKTANEELENNKKENDKFQKRSDGFKETLKNAEEELNDLLKKCPGDQQELINLNSRITTIEAGEKNYRDYSLLLEKSNSEIITLKSRLNIKNNEKVSIENEISRLDADIKRISTENMAHILKATLLEDDICPICGAKYHLTEESQNFNHEELEQLEIMLENKKKELAKLNETLAQNSASVTQEEKNILEYTQKIQELGEECKENISYKLKEEFELKKKAFEDFNTSKVKLEQDISNIKDKKYQNEQELTKYKTLIAENEKKLEDLNKDLKSNKQDKEKAYAELERIKEELGVEDLKAKQAEIQEKESKKEKLEKDTTDLRIKLDKKQEEGKRLDERINTAITEIVEKQTAFSGTRGNISAKRDSIISKAGTDENLEEEQVALTRNIKEIEDNFNKSEREKNENAIEYNKSKEKVTEIAGRVTSLKERMGKEKYSLEEALKEEEFSDVYEVENYILEKSVILELKAEIENYDRDLNEMKIKIKDLENKINDRSLSKEQWDEIQRKKMEIEKNLNETRDLMVTGEDNLKKLKERFLRKNKILEKKQVIDRKIGLIDDIEKLFKGKKFVEYVAINQLKYVAVEACKKLKEITSGTYGLEVDENGKFLIRDYKNGGAKRDASTLSGGETFLASLSLALALSAQIQLKGTAPLELFFLDEGFGTLDDNLLEVVMDSLEKIHNDKLSVGIISHLDAIKNRIPVKLIITPAEAGMGGSKVKIERN